MRPEKPQEGVCQPRQAFRAAFFGGTSLTFQPHLEPFRPDVPRSISRADRAKQRPCWSTGAREHTLRAHRYVGHAAAFPHIRRSAAAGLKLELVRHADRSRRERGLLAALHCGCCDNRARRHRLDLKCLRLRSHDRRGCSPAFGGCPVPRRMTRGRAGVRPAWP